MPPSRRAPGLLRPLQPPRPLVWTLARQRPRCVPVARGFGAAAVPDARAAADRGFQFISRWRLQFRGISQRVPVRGAGTPPGALEWAYLLFSGLTCGLGATEKSSLPLANLKGPDSAGKIASTPSSEISCCRRRRRHC